MFEDAAQTSKMSVISANSYVLLEQKSIHINGIFLGLDKALAQLKENNYLDDLLLDFFIEFTRELCIGEGGNGSGGKYCVLSSLFYTILSMCGDDNEEYLRLRKWLKRISTPLLLNDAIVIPMYCSQISHWWLIVICHPRRIFEQIKHSLQKTSSFQNIEASDRGWIICMDSLGGKNIGMHKKKKAIVNILKFLDIERQNNDIYSELLEGVDDSVLASEETTNAAIVNISYRMSQVFMSLSSWEIIYNPANLPFQENKFDCGIYIIEYTHWLFHDGTAIFNFMVNDDTSSENSDSTWLQQNWFSRKWFQNRRAVYSRVLKFMGAHADWKGDRLLRSRLAEMFDDSATIPAGTGATESEHPSSLQTRSRFVMSSLNRKYFDT